MHPTHPMSFAFTLKKKKSAVPLQTHKLSGDCTRVSEFPNDPNVNGLGFETNQIKNKYPPRKKKDFKIN